MPYKVVNDAVHGAIRVEGPILELMDTLELQRLNAIRQLGLTYLTFPGANHSRIEHSLGVYHVANRIAKNLGLEKHESDLVHCAALLHDVGHGPFSHTLEHVINEILGMDHMEFTERIIVGEEDNVHEDDRKEFGDVKRICDILESHDIEPREVAKLVRGGGEHRLGPIIHGTIDVDQIDYLLRDAHYTGVAHGIIDVDRLAETISIFEGSLVIDKKGVAAVEGLLVARALMFSSVYFHKTVRISEMMMARAVEYSEKDITSVRKMVDAELMSWLLEQGGLQRAIALMLKYRQLYKKIYELDEDQLDDDAKKGMDALRDSSKRKELESEICKASGAPKGSVIVDMPRSELDLSEPRLNRVDLRIFDEGETLSLESLSPLGKALKTRKTSDWCLMVSADKKHRDAVSDSVEKVVLESLKV
jgi:HD superfamily phosphohydrolase